MKFKSMCVSLITALSMNLFAAHRTTFSDVVETAKIIPLGQNKSIAISFLNDQQGILKVTAFELLNGERLTLEDQEILKNWLHFLPEKSVDHSLVEALVVMLPVNQKIPSYSAPIDSMLDLGTFSYHSICHKIGQFHTGEYTDNGQKQSRSVLVGDKATQCYGRCGFDCGTLLYRAKYTQECLNHDLCNRVLDSQFGECSDEYWDAVDGFFNSPSC